MSNQAEAPKPEENQIIAERRAKLKALREKGFGFPNKFSRDHFADDLHAFHDEKDRDWLDLNPVVVRVAGRIMLKRLMGKATFANIQDMGGTIQLYLTDSYPGKEQHDEFKHFDIGDIVGVEGVLFKTQKGELTICVKYVALLVKSLRPLPEKYHGLTDQEQKYRQRYVDLICNEETRLNFVLRSRIIQAMRTVLLDRKSTRLNSSHTDISRMPSSA